MAKGVCIIQSNKTKKYTASHPSLQNKNAVLKDGYIYQKDLEQMPSDAGGEVVIFWSRLSLSRQVIPIYQGVTTFMPIRLYKRHGLI